MKHSSIMVPLAVLLLFNGFVLAQHGKYSNEEAAKRTEKVHQKVVKIGTGDNAKVDVELFDGKKYSGYISENADKSFVVMDAKNNPTAIKYSDVERLDRITKMGNRQKYIWIGVFSGVAVVVALFVHAVFSEY